MPFEWWNVEGAISIVFENPRAGVIVVDLDDGFRALENIDSEIIRIESGVEISRRKVVN